MEIYISHTSYILSTFFLIPLFPIVLNSTSPCITWLPSTSLHSLNTLPNSAPLFPHTHFGLILFHMAPEHRQREHEGNEEKERARERARGERRRTGGGGSRKKGWRKKQKRETKNWRRYVGLRQQRRHISGRNAVIILLSLLPLSFFSCISALVQVSLSNTEVHPLSEYTQEKRRRKEKNKVEGSERFRRLKRVSQPPSSYLILSPLSWLQMGSRSSRTL